MSDAITDDVSITRECATPVAHEDEARAFHEANPQVYEELSRLALGAVRLGHKRLGIRMLWEVTRWKLTIAVVAPGGFRLNDHYHSWYARELMRREPELANVFELRK